MNTPEPKFSVGEVVMVRCEVDTQYNSDHAVITHMEYWEGKTTRHTSSGRIFIDTGWQYEIENDGIFTNERLLRKRPPPADKEFAEDLKEMLGGVVKQGEKV